MSDNQDNTQEPWDQNIPWEFIERVALVEYKEKFSSVPESTFRFAANDGNRQAVIDSALKSLQKTDPENATFEKAEVLADLLRSFAKVIISDLDKVRETK